MALNSWPGLVRPGLFLAWPVLAWRDLVWCGVVLHGFAWLGLARRRDLACYGSDGFVVVVVWLCGCVVVWLCGCVVGGCCLWCVVCCVYCVCVASGLWLVALACGLTVSGSPSVTQ